MVFKGRLIIFYILLIFLSFGSLKAQGEFVPLESLHQEVHNKKIKQEVLDYYMNLDNWIIGITKEDAQWISVYKSPIEYNGYSFYVCTQPISSVVTYMDAYVDHNGQGRLYFSYGELAKIIMSVIPIEHSEKAVSLLQYYLHVPEFKGVQYASDDEGLDQIIIKTKLNDSITAITPFWVHNIQSYFPITGNRYDLSLFGYSSITDTAAMEMWQEKTFGQTANARLYVLYEASDGQCRISVLENQLNGKYAYSFVSFYEGGTRIYEMEGALYKQFVKNSQSFETTIIYNQLIREIVFAPSISNEDKYKLVSLVNDIIDSFEEKSINYSRP